MNFLLTEGPGRANKIWGTSSNDMYFVANNGLIIHYNGTTFTKLESGTIHNIYDIWGATNPKTNETEILAVGNLYPDNVDRIILKIYDLSVSTLSDSNISWTLSGVWFIPNKHYYVVGSGIYEKQRLSDIRWQNEPTQITTYSTAGVRGTFLNNVFVAGAYGEFLHFNGVSWRSYRTSGTGLSDGAYGPIALKGNTVFTVGQLGNRGIVLRMRR